MKAILQKIRQFLRQHPTGKVLVLLVCLKLFIMFAILRVFFFQPAMHGMGDEEKAFAVGVHLENPHKTQNQQPINP